MAAPKKNKFSAKRTVVDGIKFDSAAEATRYQDLLNLERAKKIFHLERQAEFDIRVNGKLICRYKADFIYSDGFQFVAEDLKGTETKDFKIKWKLCQALFPGYDWRIVKAGKRGR